MASSIPGRVLPFGQIQRRTNCQCINNIVNLSYRAACSRNSPNNGYTHHFQHSRAVVTAASPQQDLSAPPTDSIVIENDIDPDKLLGILRSTKNYTQLAAYVKSQQQVFLQSPLCVYALLHAVQLRDTISDENIGKGYLSSEDKILQHMELVSYYNQSCL